MSRLSSALLLAATLIGFVVPCDASEDDRRHRAQKTGDALQIGLPLISFGFTALHEDGEGAMQFTKAAALTVGVTSGLKMLIHDERPDGGRHAFPSGHTSISLASAEFLRERYGWNYGIPAYVAASYVGYSRVYAKKHYWDEVAVGAGIGYLSSHLFTTPYKNWMLGLDVEEKRYGLALTTSW